MMLVFACTAVAQTSNEDVLRRARAEQFPDVKRFISDLSKDQIAELDKIAAERKDTIDKLKAELKATRDSIRVYRNTIGNQTKKIYPLFDKEAELQAKLSKEMYRTRTKIDFVLTLDQLKTLHHKLSNEHKRTHITRMMKRMIFPRIEKPIDDNPNRDRLMLQQ